MKPWMIAFCELPRDIWSTVFRNRMQGLEFLLFHDLKYSCCVLFEPLPSNHLYSVSFWLVATGQVSQVLAAPMSLRHLESHKTISCFLTEAYCSKNKLPCFPSAMETNWTCITKAWKAGKGWFFQVVSARVFSSSPEQILRLEEVIHIN